MSKGMRLVEAMDNVKMVMRVGPIVNKNFE
jgi:hypothetical protein